MEQGALKSDHISMLILDEADEMLDMGFADEIDRIVSKLPQKRQTLFFRLLCRRLSAHCSVVFPPLLSR